VLDDRTIRLDGLGDLVDPAGALAGDGEWVRPAHPAIDRLVRHGWHWGPAGRQTRREELFRPFGAEGLG